VVEASLGASTDDDFFDELFFLLLLLLSSSSSSHHRHRRLEEFRGQGFLPGGHIVYMCSYVFLFLILTLFILEIDVRVAPRFKNKL